MANLQLGDKIKFPVAPLKINGMVDVAPVKFDAVEENWVVCPQVNATHMVIIMNVSNSAGMQEIEYRLIEIGKCENTYLLADAIVG